MVLQRLFDAPTISKITGVGATGIDLACDEENLQKSIFSKPNSAVTTAKVQLSLLSTIPAAMSFEGTKIQWMSASQVSKFADYFQSYI